MITMFDASNLMEDFRLSTGNVNRWMVPFPMGVFGTLRKGWGNTRLMGFHNGPYEYISHHKAFLPHFVAVGLAIHHEEGASAVFEVFTYDPENWTAMIPRVDSLEGFSPRLSHTRRSWYHRTLVSLRVLPDEFEHEEFCGRGSGGGWRDKRTLDIPMDDWDKYPVLPCWVYSSVEENTASKKSSDTPIIWDGR